MTSSLRGLAACTALLISLGLGWVLDLGAPAAPSSPRLWAGRPESVQSLRWLRQGSEVGERAGQQLGQQELMAVRREAAGWAATPAGAGRAFPAKARVIDDLLDVLAAARWHRRQPVARAGAVHLRVVLATERGELVIGLGEALGEQRWLVVSDRALLVDAWVARVLEQAAAELLDLAALPDAARAPTLELHRSGAAPWQSEALVVQGAWRVSPSRARLDEALARALRDQLSALQLVPEPAAAGDVGAPRWSIRVAGGPQGEATLSGLADGSGVGSVVGPGAGTCPGGVRVTSSRLGAGCLAEPAVRALAALVDRAASAAGADARPLAAATADIVEWSVATSSGPPDRVRLSRRGAGGWDGERGAAGFAVEPAAAEALLALLTSPWRISEALPRTPALLALTARHRDGSTVTLSLHQGPGAALVAVREGEPLALLSPVAPSVTLGGLELSPRALVASLASLTLWSLEPTAVSRVALGGQLLRRGEVIGEWLDARGQLVPAARAAALEELLAGLSSLRALARKPAPPSRHRLTVWIDDSAPRRAGAQGPGHRQAEAPPAAAQHTLELSLIRGECAGRADGEGVVVSSELCAQLAALVP